MAERIVVKPNGLFAEFSEIVDDFIHFNMTEEEVYEIYRLRAIEESKRTVAFKISTAKHDMNRWQEALDIIEEIHGEDKLIKDFLISWRSE